MRNNLVAPSETQPENVLAITESTQMDVDVEMNSLNVTPTQHMDITKCSSILSTASSTSTSVLKPPTDSINKSEHGNHDSKKCIENKLEEMETTDLDTSAMIVEHKQPEQTTDELIENMISKIFNATWNEYSVGSMICPQTASFLEHYPYMRFDFETIIHDVILECVLKLLKAELEIPEGTDANSSADLEVAAANATVTTTAVSTSDTKVTTSPSSSTSTATTSSGATSNPTYSTPKKIKSDDTEVQEILANAAPGSAGGTRSSIFFSENAMTSGGRSGSARENDPPASSRGATFTFNYISLF